MKTLLVVLLIVCAVQSNSAEALRRVKRIIGGTEAEKPPVYEGPPRTSTTAAPPSSPRPTQRYVENQERSAVVKGLVGEDGVNSFLGIRYARPPLGRLRFQRPRRLKLKGDVDATRYGPPCPQWSRYYPRRIIGSEDCLFLNVFAPQTEGKYPVVVWIHGGNFHGGSGAQYYPRDLVNNGVMVVTINYRLGSLGYLSSGRKDLPGNVGLFDMATASKWVREYASYFGGDPDRIVLAGQGSGASSATLLALNSKTRSASKYSGILAMSGSPVSPFALDDQDVRTGQQISAEDGCRVEDDKVFVRCMQKLPLDQLMNGDATVGDKRKNGSDFPVGLTNLNGPGPRKEGKDDGRFLPNFILESPLESIKNNRLPKGIPLMTGVTNQETGGGVKGNFLEEIRKKLLTPTFLQSTLFTKALEANTGLYVNDTVDPQLMALFLQGDYIKIFTQLVGSVLSDLDTIVKHTTDSFFNLPAFVTSTLWSKKNKVYLYSFEHVAKSVNPANLLNIPLISQSDKPVESTDKTGAEHGDDLAYLFDIRSLEGEPINQTGWDDSDSKVKDHFTTSVAEFARSGRPKARNAVDWSPFSSKSGDYLVFKEEPKMSNNFHKCEMGLWTGDNGLLGSPECSFLQATELVTSTLGSAGSSLLSTVDGIEGRLKIPGLSSGATDPLNVLGGGGVSRNPLTGAGSNKNPLSSLTGGGAQNPLSALTGGGSGLFSLPGGTSSNKRPTTTTGAPLSKTTRKPGGLLGGGLFG